MSFLAKLQSLPPDIVDSYLKTRRGDGIPEEMKDYILHLNAVPAIMHHAGASMTRVVKALRQQFPELTFSTARERYYDAVNFFHVDDNISSAAWDNYYADKMEDLARLCIAEGKYDTAKRCYDQAHGLKTQSADRLKPADWKPPVFIITNRIDPEALGFKKKALYDISRKSEAGFYNNLINSLQTTDSEKERLRREADIEDVECEIPDEDGE